MDSAICVHNGFDPRARNTVMSAKASGTSRPITLFQQRESASPGLVVTIATSSRSLKPRPRCRLASLATFISPWTFFAPDGPQSGPRQIDTSRLRAAAMSVVEPYSHRLENGDQTIVPATCVGQRCQSASVTALQ